MPTATTTATARPADTSPAPRSLVLGWLVGVLTAAFGLLPWLLTGARLPLQNLWSRQTLPGDMPLALLPASQYHVSTVAALLIVGGALAGLSARWLAARGRMSTGAVTVGVASVQGAAVWQSFAALHDGLGLDAVTDRRAALYWAGMLVGTVLVAVLALVAALLVSRRAVPMVALGLVLAAVPLASWVGVWVSTLAGPGGVPLWTGQVVRWLPSVVVAGALGWCGLRSAGRVAVWVVGAVVLWAAPLVITAATSALGTRAFRGDPTETVDQALGVLRSAAASGVTVSPTVWALLGGVVVTGIRAAARRG